VVSTIGFRGDSAIGRHQPDADRNSPNEAPSLRSDLTVHFEDGREKSVRDKNPERVARSILPPYGLA